MNKMEMYQNGYSTYQIAKRYKCSPQAIRQLLIRKGIKLRNPNPKKYLIKILDMPEGEYWHGYISANGKIAQNKIIIRTHKKDIRHLYQLVKDLCIPIKPKKYKNQAYVKVSSPELIKMIRMKPEIISRHYLRGLFDGSGRVTINHNLLVIRISSRDYFFIKWFQDELFRMVGCNKNKIVKRKCSFYTSWYGSDAIKICRKLYVSSTRYLESKVKKIFPHLYNKVTDGLSGDSHRSNDGP